MLIQVLLKVLVFITHSGNTTGSIDRKLFNFSRFVTIHGTHEAIVKDNVGYNCVGHGYFLEDGYEEQNHILGMDSQPVLSLTDCSSL